MIVVGEDLKVSVGNDLNKYQRNLMTVLRFNLNFRPFKYGCTGNEGSF